MFKKHKTNSHFTLKPAYIYARMSVRITVVLIMNNVLPSTPCAYAVLLRFVRITQQTLYYSNPLRNITEIL
jgi:hypothetical protein